MGHAMGKDIYRALGRKIDNLTVRTPWNDSFRELLTELYEPDEADLVTSMPFTLSTIERLSASTGIEIDRLSKRLEGAADKGLIGDFYINGEYHYAPSPFAVGIFEFTMMRTEGRLNYKRWAELFDAYLDSDNGVMFTANLSRGERVSFIRTMPHEEAIKPSEYVEVLDYEKASSIIKDADKMSIGMCSCRHEKHHLGEKKCDVPLETCSSFGIAAEYLVRHKMAREVSREEMLDNLEKSREMGLVLTADNVQKNVTFMCHCCRDCCNILVGIKKYGYPNVLVTSNYIVRSDDDKCEGCAKCAAACPINATKMRPVHKPLDGKKVIPHIDTELCIGCGVCALSCSTGAMSLVKRGQRVLHPETTFERIVLSSLERGTLQNQIFDNPQSLGHAFMRGLTGAFLKLPPVKRTLMSDMFRSSFLNAMKKGIALQGKGWMIEL